MAEGTRVAQEVGKEESKLLLEFEKVFEKPIGLPPTRNHEHQTILKEGAQPTCVRPYRYPYYQKNEIETFFKELLDSGAIKPSQNPFSSHVLLQSRDCQRKIPILVVNEYLDQLCGATIFELDFKA